MGLTPNGRWWHQDTRSGNSSYIMAAYSEWNWGKKSKEVEVRQQARWTVFSANSAGVGARTILACWPTAANTCVNRPSTKMTNATDTSNELTATNNVTTSTGTHTFHIICPWKNMAATLDIYVTLPYYCSLNTDTKLLHIQVKMQLIYHAIAIYMPHQICHQMPHM